MIKNQLHSKSQMVKSFQIAKLPKKKSYGHYCNLCIKYNQPRIRYKHYISNMIIDLEYKQLSESRESRLPNILANILTY